MGMLTYAYNPPGEALDEALERFRLFREQPTPELARSAGSSLAASLSFNDRLQQIYLPWTSYVIVPLFAVANAGIVVERLVPGPRAPLPGDPRRRRRLRGRQALGFLGGSWLVTRLSRGRVLPPVGWASVAGGGTIAGIGFTVSLLVAGLSLQGTSCRRRRSAFSSPPSSPRA